MATTESAQGVDGANSAAAKPKRVRTGCLTCRERHLKCDEGVPTCNNCRKSSRPCRRGVRLNFIDTQCKLPPVILTPRDRDLSFLDESVEIASEYVGGKQQYDRWTNSAPALDGNSFGYSRGHNSAPAISHQHSLPAIQGMRQTPHSAQPHNVNMFDQPNEQQQHTHDSSQFSNHSLASHHQQYDPITQALTTAHQAVTSGTDQDQPREILNTQEETLYMQVFVEEVGLWMDSMDSMKHFSRILPFHALTQPMLLNAFLACGVRHLTLVNPAVYKEEKALQYYDTASRYLLRALENPERDSVICATTAVILNVYEIMTEKALMRMNHIAGARALIKECGWNARSEGIGAACFWINVGMELLSNLHFNWQASWHPDHWGLDLDLSTETRAGREEIWTHRILYITAKIGDFRATIPARAQETSPQNDTVRNQKRLEEWSYLKQLADAWNSNIPRTMHPAAYLYPYQTRSKSAFPEVWLIKRPTIIARLFYHTAMTLLAQVHPILSKDTPDMHEMEQHHAHQICGIVAHVKDRGVASVAIRSLAIAAETLNSRREQEEALQIFMRIHKETGWRLGFIPTELTEKWGWSSDERDNAIALPTISDPISNHYLAGGANSKTRTNSMSSNIGNGTSSSPSGSNNFVNGGGMMRRSMYAPGQFDQYGEMQRMQQQQAAARASSQQSPVAGHQHHHHHQQHQQRQQQQQQQQQQQSSSSSSSSPQQPRKAPPQGIVNPMFASADFAMPKHPYQEYYVAPNPHAQHQHHGLHQSLALGMGAFSAPNYGMQQHGPSSMSSDYQFEYVNMNK